MMVRAGLAQPAGALALFEMFCFEFPEMREKSTYFFTKRDSYPVEEELTVVRLELQLNTSHPTRNDEELKVV